MASRPELAEFLAEVERAVVLNENKKTANLTDWIAWARDYADSIDPIIEAGLVDFIGPDFKLTDEVSLIPTPGHTPESISIVVWEREALERHAPDAVPYGVLTGDTLFIGDVGRPDLLASIGVTADELLAVIDGGAE